MSEGSPRVMFRLDREEHDEAEQTAASLGMTVNEFARSLILAANEETRSTRTPVDPSGPEIRVAGVSTAEATRVPPDLRSALRWRSGRSQTQPIPTVRRHA